MINSQVLLRVSTPGSAYSSGAYLLAGLFLHLKSNKLRGGNQRLGRSKGRPRLEVNIAKGGRIRDGSAPFYLEKTGLSERANLSGDTKEQVDE
jgi:hypothetical protein